MILIMITKYKYSVKISVEFLEIYGPLPLLVPNTVKLVFSLTPTITVTELIKGSTENLPCNNRGLCDETQGRCNCFDGIFGIINL